MLSAGAFSLFLLAASAAGSIGYPSGGVVFGDISAGARTERKITLRNISASTVVVSRVKACCGAEARLYPMCIAPSDTATLCVSLKPVIPGGFSKHVRIECGGPGASATLIPVTGNAVDANGVDIASSFTLPAVVLAGFADGFNPCAFSIVIALAGVLAAGGRRRRARLAGGMAFCVASFFTYMAMGLGLMPLLRALEGVHAVHDAVMSALAVALFTLSFLSVRDAYRYRKAKEPSVILLQLPGCVKKLIYSIAAAGWRGPAVVMTGFGCGFLVTLLDSLCTGQVYVPVLELVSREPGAWTSLAYLALYNLAFISPLVAVFVLAANGAGSERMSRWSKRNVFPSKIAMGVVFMVLGVLVMPRFGAHLAELVAQAM